VPRGRNPGALPMNKRGFWSNWMLVELFLDCGTVLEHVVADKGFGFDVGGSIGVEAGGRFERFRMRTSTGDPTPFPVGAYTPR
jgi:hypothetical protein